MSGISPWSFSRIKSFEQCPKKFYHLKIAKDYSESETEAMLYGTVAHEAAELYIRDGKPLPEAFKYMEPTLKVLSEMQGEKLCEYEMGLTENLEPCGFKDENVWFRGIADLVILDRENKKAKVIDYKTGKSAKYAGKGQLELMALALFKHFPEIEIVKAGLLFTVANKFITDTYYKEHEQKLWRKWLSDYGQMEAAFKNDVWNAHPSGLCRRHCVVTECPHNGRN